MGWVVWPARVTNGASLVIRASCRYMLTAQVYRYLLAFMSLEMGLRTATLSLSSVVSSCAHWSMLGEPQTDRFMAQLDYP